MSEYRHTQDMGEISGFGGGYEQCCQDMLNAGVQWVIAHPNADPKFHGFEDVYGIVAEDNDDARALTKAVIDAANGEATGAMHQAVINRVMYVARNGWDKYCAELRKHEKAES